MAVKPDWTRRVCVHGILLAEGNACAAVFNVLITNDRQVCVAQMLRKDIWIQHLCEVTGSFPLGFLLTVILSNIVLEVCHVRSVLPRSHGRIVNHEWDGDCE